MNKIDDTAVSLCSNYSGAFEHTSPTNQDLLRLTDQQGVIIYGPSLFALKYRVLPCTVNQSSQLSSTDYDNIFNFNMLGQFSALNRGRRWCGKRRQGGMYHATRLVIVLTYF
jgi:hypothetical protein